MAMIDNAKLLIGITDSAADSLLTLLKSQCEQDFCDYTNQSTVPSSAEGVVLNMLVYSYNQLGAQGLASQGYSSITESYVNGYSQNILNQMNHYRKIKVL